jgi:hypothetical protein
MDRESVLGNARSSSTNGTQCVQEDLVVIWRERLKAQIENGQCIQLQVTNGKITIPLPITLSDDSDDYEFIDLGLFDADDQEIVKCLLSDLLDHLDIKWDGQWSNVDDGVYLIDPFDLCCFELAIPEHAYDPCTGTRFLTFLRMFSYLLPRSTRLRVFEPVFCELIEDCIETRAYCSRSILTRIWQRAFMVARTVEIVSECFVAPACSSVAETRIGRLIRWLIWHTCGR